MINTGIKSFNGKSELSRRQDSIAEQAKQMNELFDTIRAKLIERMPRLNKDVTLYEANVHIHLDNNPAIGFIGKVTKEVCGKQMEFDMDVVVAKLSEVHGSIYKDLGTGHFEPENIFYVCEDFTMVGGEIGTRTISRTMLEPKSNLYHSLYTVGNIDRRNPDQPPPIFNAQKSKTYSGLDAAFTHGMSTGTETALEAIHARNAKNIKTMIKIANHLGVNLDIGQKSSNQTVRPR